MDKIQTIFFNGTLPSELSGDYILPDTYPDVKKILRVRAKPILLGRFISGGKLEYNGAVDYIVLFSAESGDGETLHSVHFAEEYSGSLAPSEGVQADSFISIEPRISVCSAGMQNPRKISLKSTVLTDVKLSKTISTTPDSDGEKLEMLVENMPTLIECSFTADHKCISENIEPDAAQPSIDEIVTCDVEIAFAEVKPQMSDGELSVALKGEAIVDCIYKSQVEIGDYRSFSRKIPLSYVINAEEYRKIFDGAAAETISAMACGIPTEINAAVGEDSYGDRRVVELDLVFDIELMLCADRESTLTLDAYSTRYESECTKKGLEILRLGKAVNSNFSVNESIPCEDILPKVDSECSRSIVNSQAQVRINSVAAAKGRAQLGGEAVISCIFCDKSEKKCEFSSCEFKLPVKCELNVGELSEPIAFACEVKAFDLRTRIDPMKLSCDFEVALELMILRRARREIVEGVVLGEEKTIAKYDNSMIVLCYPSADESRWQVAKRYKMREDELRPTADGRVIRIR